MQALGKLFEFAMLGGDTAFCRSGPFACEESSKSAHRLAATGERRMLAHSCQTRQLASVATHC